MVAMKRILVIDDSAVARAALVRLLGATGRYDVAAVPDAGAGLARLRDRGADAVLLDLDMPHTSGIEALPALIDAPRGAPVLVVSGLAGHGAAVTMRALALGAADTLEKPSAGLGGPFVGALAERLDVLLATDRGPASALMPADDMRPEEPFRALDPFDAVAIGASTGGIHALTTLLGALPTGMRQPVFVTQHLPATFTAVLVHQLSLAARRPCRVAGDRHRVGVGEVIVAPGDAHLTVVRLPDGDFATRLSTAAAPTGNLPSLDPMFATLADACGDRLLAVVLTGMGRDGLDGARAVHAAGGTVLAQDRDSSVVWGMPRAVTEAGLAGIVAPPARIGALIAAAAGRSVAR